MNQIPTKRSSQCLVGSRTVSILVVAIPAIMLLGASHLIPRGGGVRVLTLGFFFQLGVEYFFIFY